MEKDGKIIGQNIFMKANIEADYGKDIPILTMGPICITPELKRQGYGKIQLEYIIFARGTKTWINILHEQL